MRRISQCQAAFIAWNGSLRRQTILNLFGPFWSTIIVLPASDASTATMKAMEPLRCVRRVACSHNRVLPVIPWTITTPFEPSAQSAVHARRQTFATTSKRCEDGGGDGGGGDSSSESSGHDSGDLDGTARYKSSRAPDAGPPGFLRDDRSRLRLTDGARPNRYRYRYDLTEQQDGHSQYDTNDITTIVFAVAGLIWWCNHKKTNLHAKPVQRWPKEKLNRTSRK